jgi:hypothetical protein
MAMLESLQRIGGIFAIQSFHENVFFVYRENKQQIHYFYRYRQ